jgi:hypothetical protein
MTKIKSGKWNIGILREQSGGMNGVVHPAILNDNEAEFLKNPNLEEKGILKTCLGRVERFAAAFDASNPVVGMGAFYKSDGTSNIVMASGTKLYKDTPHLVTTYTSKADWDNGTKSAECDTAATPGDLKIAAGSASNVIQAVSSQSEWEACTNSQIDTTTSAGDIKIAAKHAAFSRTFDTQAEWDAGTLSNANTTASAGDVKLNKEGTDYSNTATATADFNGTHSDTQAIDNAVKLAGGSIDSYTKNLLHFDGANASTTFTDEAGKTWTAYGDAQLNTAEKKFGTASGRFDGTDDYIDTPDHDDFTLGSGNFTVDLWIKRNATGVDHAIYGQCDASVTASTISTIMQINDVDKVTVAVYSGSTSYGITSTGTITDTAWHHLAVVRNGNTLTLYIDGTADGTKDVTDVTVNNSTNKFAVSRLGEYARYFNGWIDEFRFSKGIARWTSNFTPPTEAYAAYKGSGVYTHGELIVSDPKIAKAGAISFTKTTPANTTLTVDYRIYDGSAWGAWQLDVASGATIIAKGTDLTGYKVQWRGNLATTDTAVTPSLDDVTVSVTSAYKTSGTWTSPVMNPNAGANGTATLTSVTPTNTSITKEYRTSADNTTWNAWGADGGSLTASNYVQYRLTLSTTDIAETPTAASLVISYPTVYQSSGVCTLPTLTVLNINPASNHTIAWTKTTPANTTVTVDTRGSDDNANWSAWAAQTSGNALTNLNYYMQTRITLATTDTLATPTVADITLTIPQDGKRATWTSPTIDVSSATNTGSGNLQVSSTAGDGAVSHQSRSSSDGGTAWSVWVNASADGTLNHTAQNHIQIRIIYTKTASVQSATITFDDSPAATTLLTGLTAGGSYYFTTLKDVFIIVNGIDAPKKWNGIDAVSNVGGTPPHCQYVAAHKNRIFMASVSANRSRLYWSDILDEDTWGATSYIDISPNDGDYITNIMAFGDYLIITKQRSVWILLGQAASDFAVRRLHEGIGCVAPRSLITMEDVFLFVSSEGVYVSNLSQVTLLTERLKNYWKLLNRRKLSIACASYFDHRLRVEFPYSTSTYNNRRIVYDGIRKSLYIEQFADHASCYCKFVEKGKEVLLYGHSNEGQVSQADYGTADNDAAIEMEWKTKHFNFGSSAVEKKVGRAYFAVVPASSAVTVSVYFNVDGVENATALTFTVPGSSNKEVETYKLKLNALNIRKVRTLGYRIVQATTNGGVTFQELLQEYIVKKVRETA